jgi:hypothetical protein
VEIGRAALRAGAALLFGLVGASQAAADEPICADRPGKGTGTCTVPAGHWQVETGLADWTLQKGGGERDTLVVLGETTVKFGLTERSDIAVDVTPWQRAKSGVDRASGFGDVTISYKHRLTAPDAAVEVAVLPFVKAPTAKHSLGNGKWEGGLLIPIGYAIPGSPLGLGLTPEIDWVADADGRGHHAAMAQVAGLGWQASERLNLSAEIWGQWDWDPAGTTRQASVDGAAAYLVGDSVQLDAGANVGLNRVTPDVEIYGGVSKRF